MMDKLRQEAERRLKEQIKLSPSFLKKSVEVCTAIEDLFIAKGEKIIKATEGDPEEELKKLNMNIQGPEARAISLVTAVVKIIISNNSDEVLNKLLQDVTDARVKQLLDDVDRFAKELSKGINIDPTGFSSNMN